jgi:hypothetical protein
MFAVETHSFLPYADSPIMPTSNGTERLGRLGVVPLVGIIRALCIWAPLPQHASWQLGPNNSETGKTCLDSDPEEDFDRDAAARCNNSWATR